MKRLAPSLLILLFAFALRVIGLNTVPPGWRDDEVIETTRHAQIVLDGGRPLYFIQAEGHEPLYHYVSAIWIALVGHSLFSVRLVSVFFGLLTVAAAFHFTRPLFGTRAALLVALLLAISFWALMYSRTKIRHISEPPFVLLAFAHLFKVIRSQRSATQRSHSFVTRSGHLSRVAVILFLALALYTYLAATTLFIILPAFGLYLLIRGRKPDALALNQTVAPQTWRARYIFISLAFTGLLYLPLAYAIQTTAKRIDVVGGPLAALRQGNSQPLIEHTVETLAMFGNTGDNEDLYNIPGRPVFDLVGFYFFLGGVLISAWHWRDPRYAFLLIWLVGGIAPGFASNPPGSLGHTITALPVTYILALLPAIYRWPTLGSRRWVRAVSWLGPLVLLTAIAARDLPDYFWRWPALPQVRYLYRADLHQLARTLHGAAPRTYVLNGELSKWDRLAFILEDVKFETLPRWVNAEWAMIFPAQPADYLFTPADWQTDVPAEHPLSLHFANDLYLEGWTQRGREVVMHWRVGPGYVSIEPDMGASLAPPPFTVSAFVHLLKADGSLAAGSDRFDVDIFALQPGDRFLQRHAFASDTPAGTYPLEVGLYNPLTNERYLTDDGRDGVKIGTFVIP